jgi:hypothetical protein
MTTSDIYDQYGRAFANVSAFVILDENCALVAKVAIKFPKLGDGRLWAYAHVMGCQMQRHHADGYGYDKRSPAVRGAFAKATVYRAGEVDDHEDMRRAYYQPIIDRINAALAASDGEYWDRLLEKAGFTVLQAV